MIKSYNGYMNENNRVGMFCSETGIKLKTIRWLECYSDKELTKRLIDDEPFINGYCEKKEIGNRQEIGVVIYSDIFLVTNSENYLPLYLVEVWNCGEIIDTYFIDTEKTYTTLFLANLKPMIESAREFGKERISRT